MLAAVAVSFGVLTNMLHPSRAVASDPEINNFLTECRFRHPPFDSLIERD
jgi:hypothetical protein